MPIYLFMFCLWLHDAFSAKQKKPGQQQPLSQQSEVADAASPSAEVVTGTGVDTAGNVSDTASDRVMSFGVSLGNLACIVTANPCLAVNSRDCHERCSCH